jgi:hypothetical protein
LVLNHPLYDAFYGQCSGDATWCSSVIVTVLDALWVTVAIVAGLLAAGALRLWTWIYFAILAWFVIWALVDAWDIFGEVAILGPAWFALVGRILGGLDAVVAVLLLAVLLRRGPWGRMRAR